MLNQTKTNPDGSFKAATQNPDGTPLSPTTLIVTPANKEVTLVVGRTYMFNTNTPCKFGIKAGGTGKGGVSANGAFKSESAGVDVVIITPQDGSPRQSFKVTSVDGF